MPSGKTHDAVTVLLAAPAAAIGFVVTNDWWVAILVTGGFLFGGLMFGPDLDTVSKHYSRWKFARFLWFPYRIFFKHRSRWSHGLIFGTLLRVVYFMGVATCIGFGATYFYSAYLGGELPGLWSFTSVWASLRDHSDRLLGVHAIPAIFIGMWAGAASHTFTDIAGSYVKTGRAGL